MDVALQKRRLFIALAVTAGALIVALIAVAAMFTRHAPWSIWLFAVAMLVGFGSHAWLMLGVARDKTGTKAAR